MGPVELAAQFTGRVNEGSEPRYYNKAVSIRSSSYHGELQAVALVLEAIRDSTVSLNEIQGKKINAHKFRQRSLVVYTFLNKLSYTCNSSAGRFRKG